MESSPLKEDNKGLAKPISALNKIGIYLLSYVASLCTVWLLITTIGINFRFGLVSVILFFILVTLAPKWLAEIIYLKTEIDKGLNDESRVAKKNRAIKCFAVIVWLNAMVVIASILVSP